MLDRQTLVLNRSWRPITTTTVRRAIVLMARGVAGAVHPATFEVAAWETWIEVGSRAIGSLRGIGFDFPVPEVIVLTGYNGMPDAPVSFTRRNVYRRDGFACVYCGHAPRSAELTLDHVVPRSRGGPTDWRNCVTACVRCNARKADRTPSQADMRMRRQPTMPRWPGGLDPGQLAERPVWHRFMPANTPGLAK
ncbi:MAG: HNH endonuclease [Planctomycetota bacterium]|nr:HNH endonuclease [Planctomycetota bacterium]